MAITLVHVKVDIVEMVLFVKVSQIKISAVFLFSFNNIKQLQILMNVHLELISVKSLVNVQIYLEVTLVFATMANRVVRLIVQVNYTKITKKCLFINTAYIRLLEISTSQLLNNIEAVSNHIIKTVSNWYSYQYDGIGNYTQNGGQDMFDREKRVSCL